MPQETPAAHKALASYLTKQGLPPDPNESVEALAKKLGIETMVIRGNALEIYGDIFVLFAGPYKQCLDEMRKARRFNVSTDLMYVSGRLASYIL